LLALPVSPGALALLLPHAKEPAVRERWAAALADERPHVRSAAARVITVSGLRDLTPAVAAALEAESDADAAEEQLLACLLLAPDSAWPAAERAARRLSSDVAATYVAWIAMHRQAVLPSHLFALAGQVATATLATGLARATASVEPPARRTIAAAARSLGIALWRQFLVRVDGNNHALLLDEHVLRDALDDPDRAIVERAALSVVKYASVGISGAAELVGTVAIMAERAGGASPTLRVAAVLGARAVGLPEAGDADLTALVERWSMDDADRRLLIDLELLLSGAERAAAQKRLGVERWLEWVGTNLQGPPPTRLIRTLTSYPRELVRDTLRAAGCRPSREAIWLAVTYRRDGRPERVSVQQHRLSRQCRRAAAAIGMASLQMAGEPFAPVPHFVRVDLHGRSLDCLEEYAGYSEALVAAAAAPQRTLPHVDREVRPNYTADALRAQVQGVVILRAQVAPSGCVCYAEVRRGIDDGLDLEALAALTRWRFRPIPHDDTRVIRQISVEMTFAVR
jgi:TonB family protein